MRSIRIFFDISLAAVVALPVAAQPARKSASVKPVWPDEGPMTWAPRPTVADITANDLRTRLYQFADDSMAGRRIGEPGNYKGTDYIAREFKRLGLKPAGDNGSYFQDLPFGPMGFDSTSAKLGTSSGAMAARTDWIPLAPSPVTGVGGKADLANVATEFAGRWGDTSVVLDPAVFGGKVAVFTASPASFGMGPARVAPVPACDAVPDKFGASAAAQVEAAVRDSITRAGGTAPAGGRGGAPTGARDSRAMRAGVAGILVIVVARIEGDSRDLV